MGIKLYYNLMSQPSRALYILFKGAKIPHEGAVVDLAKGEHYGEEFTAVNRFNKVPCITRDGFTLTESPAIAKYLADERLIPEAWYPKGSLPQARVNEFLSWQHIGVRAPCSLYFWAVVLDPMMTGKPTPQGKIDKLKTKMDEALDIVENKWLGSGNKYIAGDSITVADVFGCCEIEQPRMAGYDPKVGRPNLAAWMERVKTEMNPHYDEAHTILNKIATKRASKL